MQQTSCNPVYYTIDKQNYVEKHIKAIEDLVICMDSFYENHIIFEGDNVFIECNPFFEEFETKKCDREITFNNQLSFEDFYLGINSPQLCGKRLVQSAYNFLRVVNIEKSYIHKINKELTLQLTVHSRFKEDTKHLNERYTGSVSVRAIDQDDEIMYKGKYGIVAEILIPKHLD